MSFAPVYNEHSRALILGTWPSPKSREMSFYYGHPQNRFWPMLAALTGEAEEALLELLCQAAEQQWEKRLRPGMTTEDCGKAFPCAVAFTAAADLAAARGGEGVSGFTAGSVSVRIRGAAESCALAESLRRTAERLMAPFAVPDDFCFRGVRG